MYPHLTTLCIALCYTGRDRCKDAGSWIARTFMSAPCCQDTAVKDKARSQCRYWDKCFFWTNGGIGNIQYELKDFSFFVEIFCFSLHCFHWPLIDEWMGLKSLRGQLMDAVKWGALVKQPHYAHTMIITLVNPKTGSSGSVSCFFFFLDSIQTVSVPHLKPLSHTS